MKHIRNKTFGLFLNLFREERVVGLAEDDAPETAPALDESSPEDDEARLDAAVEATTAAGKTARTTTRSKVERDVLYKRIEEKKNKAKEFSHKIAKAVREGKISPKTWEVNNKNALDQVCNDFKTVIGLYPPDVAWMKGELKYAFSTELTKDKKNIKLKTLYQFPGENLDDLRAENPSFYLAYAYFLTIKDIALRAADSLGVVDKKMRTKDHDMLFDKVTDGVSELGSDVIKAVEERDYSKLALYGVAAYAFYKIYDKLKSSSSVWGKRVKDFALYGTAAYCGLAIFAPDYLKKIQGKGVHADIKDTAYEVFDDLLARSPSLYKEGIEVGLMTQLSDARVKDLYGYITEGHPSFDRKSSSKGILPISKKGVNRFFDADLVSANPGSRGGPLSAKEKLYSETSRQLFVTLKGLEQLYNVNVQPRTGKNFRDEFLYSGENFTIHDVVSKIREYEESSRDFILTPELAVAARTELSGIFDDKVDGLHVKGSVMEGRGIGMDVRGYPVVAKVDYKHKKKFYVFYLANDAGTGALPVSSYEVGKESSASNAREDLLTAIRIRMKHLLGRITVGGEDGTVAIKYNPDNNKWEGPIKLKGAPAKYGLTEPVDDFIHAEVRYDGEVLFVECDRAAGNIVLDEMASMKLDYADLVLNEIISPANPEFNALGPLRDARGIELVEMPESKNQFTLRVLGRLDLTCTVAKDAAPPAKKYTIDTNDQKKLISDPEFRRVYVEEYDKQYLGFFDNMKEYAGDMPENYVFYFFEGAYHWIADAKKDAWFDGFSTEAFSGSIPDYYTYMLIDAKRQALKDQMFLAIGGASDLSDIETKKSKVFDFTAQMKSYYTKILSTQFPGKDRKTWDREDFNARILSPLKRAGVVSDEYKHALEKFETKAFQKLATKGSDISTDAYKKVGKMIGIYQYITMGQDTAELDDWSDKDKRAKNWKISNFFEGSGDLIINFYGNYFLAGGSVDSMPPISKCEGLVHYERWEKINPVSPPLTELSKERYDHETLLTEGPDKGRTELEAAVAKAFSDAVEDLKDEFGSDFDGILADQQLAIILGHKDGNLKNKLITQSKRPAYNMAVAIHAKNVKRDFETDEITGYYAQFIHDLMTEEKYWTDPDLGIKERVKIWNRKRKLN